MSEDKLGINEAGLSILKRFEGYSSTPYLDVVGVRTIGYGHTGPAAKANGSITRQHALELLEMDLATAQSAVVRLVTVPLNENQFSALVSFVYNVGQGNFARSRMRGELNEGNYQLAAEEFRSWDGKPGKKIRGLSQRRGAEQQLFLTPPRPTIVTASFPVGNALYVLASDELHHCYKTEVGGAIGEQASINEKYANAIVLIINPQTKVFTPEDTDSAEAITA